jgi:Predicted dehydrogenases and related proteins
MKILRYGILSTASIVPRFINALRESGSGEVVAVASRSAEKAREKANQWNIEKSYGSYEELLMDKDIDVVYVAMINSEHYQYALKALEHGKHVICEKPFTLKKEEAQYLFKVAGERKLFIAEAQKAVFLPVMRDIRQLLADGKLGRMHFADFTSSCSSVYNEWLHSEKAGGGALYGNASYSVHLARYLFDSEISAYSGLCTKGDSAIDEQCVLNLRLENSMMVISKISTNVLAVNKAFLYGDLGYIEIADYWKARTATVHYNSGEEQELSHPCRYELIYEIEHFNRCINDGLLQSPVMNEEMTVSTIELMESLHDSWK